MHAWIDLSLMTLTFLLTIFVNVEVSVLCFLIVLRLSSSCPQVGILVSVTLSMILCIREAASMRVKILGRVSGTRGALTTCPCFDRADISRQTGSSLSSLTKR